MRKNILLMQRIGFAGLSSLLVFVALALISSQKRIDNAYQAGQHFVVMELFTSQGCSSCPPADKLLAEYANAGDAHIIPLSFHVDYWNRLGWADPFSNGSYSQRQQWYSEHLPKGSVYTPQLIINGKSEVVGNDRNAVNGLVRKELSDAGAGSILVDNILFEKNKLHFHYTTAAVEKDDVINIAIIEKSTSTQIKAGENAGVTINNHNVVRAFHTQPATNDGNVSMDVSMTFNNKLYALVVYVQNSKKLTISMATQRDLL